MAFQDSSLITNVYDSAVVNYDYLNMNDFEICINGRVQVGKYYSSYAEQNVIIWLAKLCIIQEIIHIASDCVINFWIISINDM